VRTVEWRFLGSPTLTCELTLESTDACKPQGSKMKLHVSMSLRWVGLMSGGMVPAVVLLWVQMLHVDSSHAKFALAILSQKGGQAHAQLLTMTQAPLHQAHIVPSSFPSGNRQGCSGYP
jgi:hypothetical protein